MKAPGEKLKMLYIIGVDHLIQYKNSILPVSVFNRFKKFIRETLSECDIHIIAEEFNREYLEEVYSSDEGTLESCSRDCGVRHIYCDPGKREREELGIPYYADIRESVKADLGISDNYITDLSLYREVEDETSRRSKRYWKIRERFWLSKLSDVIDERILFVCGHEHVESFRRILKEKSIESKILEHFWGKELFSDYKNFGLE
jgi:hypothetical protein